MATTKPGNPSRLGLQPGKCSSSQAKKLKGVQLQKTILHTGASMQVNHKEVSVTSKVHPTAGWTNLIRRTSQNYLLQRQQGRESVSHPYRFLWLAVVANIIDR